MSNSVASPGRPPVLDEAKRRELILRAAEEVFTSLGYGDATMEEVARACGMAKKSVYKLFPDKPALFRSLIQSHDPVDAWVASPDEAADPRDRLRELLIGLAAFILSPRQLALTRLVISEARKSPDLADLFYRECMDRAQSLAVERLQPTNLLASAVDMNRQKLLVDVFLGATLGQLHLQALILDTDQDTLMEQLRLRIDIALAALYCPAT